MLELSSFQLETTHSLKAEVASIINVSEDHMDRYDSLAAYNESKQRIYNQCVNAVYWQEDKATWPLGVKNSNTATPEKLNHNFCYGGPYNWASIDHSTNDIGPNSGYIVAKESDQSWVMKGQKPILGQADTRIKGDHNLLNIAAVFTMAEILGIPESAMIEAAKAFPGLDHRCQWISSIDGVDWYNDSKGTNVGATVAAITGIGGGITGKLILIAGGEAKGACLDELCLPAEEYIKTTILIGRDAPEFKKNIKRCMQPKRSFNTCRCCYTGIANS